MTDSVIEHYGVKIELDEDLEQSALPSYNDPNWSDEELDAMSTEEFLAHYGVKGMKWGVRKDRESSSKEKTQSFGGLVTKTTAKGLVTVGGGAAGRVIGSSLGAAVLGPGIGNMVGGYVGSFAGSRIAATPIVKREEARKKAALSNLSTAVPNRNAKYTDGMLKSDINQWGVDSAKRINDSMNSGMSRNAATSQESSLRFKAGLVSFGAVFATSFTARSAYSKVNTADLKNKAYTKAYNKAYDRNQSRQAATNRADNFGLKPAPTMAKRNRKGVYNITTMK